MNDLFAWNNNPRHVSGSYYRNIIPLPKNINNIPSASRKAKRYVKGNYVPRKAAFTLAEVLITLGIIGVVAAMTLPTLIQNQQEKEKVVRLKKVYSVLNSAIQRAITEDGPISSWSGLVESQVLQEGMTDEEKEEIQESNDKSRYAFLSHIKPYLSFVKYCENDENCSPKLSRYSLDGMAYSYVQNTLFLSDGTAIFGVWIYDPTCNYNAGNTKALKKVCGQMSVDIMAGKTERKLTGDTLFMFWITEYGLYPMGSAMEVQKGEMTYTFDEYCNISKPYKYNGYGCTAWVLINENMDYKKCSDLSWNGKRKCK